jgi:hypothetical protein
MIFSQAKYVAFESLVTTCDKIQRCFNSFFLIVYFWKKSYCSLDNSIVIHTYINNTNHVHDKKVVITSRSTKLSNAKVFIKLQTTV